jgi:hypothetical protein
MSDVAIYFPAWGTSSAFASARRLFANPVIRTQLAALILRAGPRGAAAAGRAVFGNAAIGAALMQYRAQGEHGLRNTQSGVRAELLDRGGIQWLAVAATQRAWQFDLAVTNALEAADQKTL